ncbi:MAG: NAD(P)/FAD-dependent oxidoreductase, partial [Caldilineaceae bacterium]|nr:NAD(P)/FAD-dependent oxidoreductase [Caldilineaceae bacterium]
LARAGKQVLVLEARERIGGACTLEETWPGYRISPCAYLAGLLQPLVIDELDFAAHGYHWTPAVAGMFVPFDDGSSIQLWDDDVRCAEEIRRFAPGDVAGWKAMYDVMRRCRDALRPAGDGDLWIGTPPSRDEIEDRLRGDQEAVDLLFNWSMVEYTEHFLKDERLQTAVLGQGVIGTNASPHDPGTAFIHFHHSSGRLGGMTGMWGYVRGGMGMVSFLLADIAREAGAVIASGTPVAQILPGEGVMLVGGERIAAPIVVSNADPQVTSRLLGESVDAGWQAQVAKIPMKGCTAKVSVVLNELPNFRARSGTNEPHHSGQINTPLTKDEWKRYPALANAGALPPRLWTELYFQTVHDSSVAPAGMHTMSVFAQYVPHTFAEGDWDSRREEVAQTALASIGRYCSNFPAAVAMYEVLGPPDIEAKVGLSGGHIFQGECLPPYMWDQRLAYRTPMTGVYLCGACTHPGGSVIAINGRNAAMAILKDGKG